MSERYGARHNQPSPHIDGPWAEKQNRVPAKKDKSGEKYWGCVEMRTGGGDLQSGQETGQGSFILTFIALSIPASNCWSTRGVYMYWNARN